MYVSKIELRSSLQNILLIIGIFLPMILIFIALKLYNQRIENINKNSNLLEKITEFRTAPIVRWAMIEACIIFNLVFFLGAGSQYNLLLAILLLGYFAYNAPTKTKIGLALELDQKDIEVLYQK